MAVINQLMNELHVSSVSGLPDLGHDMESQWICLSLTEGKPFFVSPCVSNMYTAVGHKIMECTLVLINCVSPLPVKHTLMAGFHYNLCAIVQQQYSTNTNQHTYRCTQQEPEEIEMNELE